MLERIGPLVISMIICFLSFRFNIDFSELSDYKFIYSNIISFSSIIIGFLITMVSILITLTNKRVMIKIRELKADNLLKSYFVFPILSGLFLVLLSIILGIVFDSNGLNVNNGTMTSIWIFTLVYFVTTTCRIFIIMLKLLNRVHEEELRPESKRVEPDIKELYFNSNNEEEP